jgi:hypothetical protein
MHTHLVVPAAQVDLGEEAGTLHLYCCEMVKVRSRTLHLIILRGGAQGASASQRAGTTTRGLRCHGAVDSGGLLLPLLIGSREAHGLLQVGRILHLHVRG